MWQLPKYYSEKDFDKTDAILKEASKQKLTKFERARLNKLMLANKHARLTCEAIIANNRDTKGKDEAKRLAVSKKLLEFRKKHKNDLTINWAVLFDIEKSFGDVTGVQFSQIFKEKINPVKSLPVYWHFKMDPENVGLKQGWEKESWKNIKKNWGKIRTDRPWEEQVKVDKELAEKLKKYNGIGWYATAVYNSKAFHWKKVYLTFGAVDESCWVYVNGKEAGKHLYKKSDDWKTPFSIRIDEAFNDSKRQIVTVRVQDKAGMGGIWKTVWLTTD